MKWTIAFDSGCDIRDLSPDDTASLELVPLKIQVGTDEIADDGHTSMEVLQHILDMKKGRTGTACPSVGEWEKAMEQGDNVIAITISGAVSGSYQSAVIAREEVLENHPDKNIFVMNSVSGSGTMQFLVRKAMELIQSGSSFEQVCQGLTEYRSHSQIFFLLQNVDNVMSSGRLNPIIGKAVKALKLCLLATVSPEGKLEVIGKVRGFQKAMDRSIEECIHRGCEARKIIISHCMNLPGALEMKEKLLARFPSAQVEIMATGLLCGYYAEKGGLIVALQP